MSVQVTRLSQGLFPAAAPYLEFEPAAHVDRLSFVQDPERKKEVTGLLGEVSDERFADLVELGKRMTDFTTEPTAEDATAGDMLDDDIGVAVEFEGEDEDDEDENVDEIAVGVPSLMPCRDYVVSYVHVHAAMSSALEM